MGGLSCRDFMLRFKYRIGNYKKCKIKEEHLANIAEVDSDANSPSLDCST